MACIATRLMSSGAAKSGKPCDRFTAPYFIASRVISRMTDSVNRLALRDTEACLETTGTLILIEIPEVDWTNALTRFGLWQARLTLCCSAADYVAMKLSGKLGIAVFSLFLFVL